MNDWLANSSFSCIDLAVRAMGELQTLDCSVSLEDCSVVDTIKLKQKDMTFLYIGTVSFKQIALKHTGRPCAIVTQPT